MTAALLLLHERHAASWGDALRADFPEVRLAVQKGDGSFDGDPAGATAYLIPPWLKTAIEPALVAAPRVRWVHSPAAGVDHLPLALLESRGIALTNGRGVHTIPVAEGAIALLLALSKGLPESRDDQRVARWNPQPIAELHGATVGVLGTGDIGTAIAERLVALGAVALGCSRSGEKHPPFERVFPVGRLNDFLSEVDHLVAALPGTATTRGLLDGGALGVLRKGAFFVNVGRGNVVSERDLVAGLDATLAGAALDVFESEPLPASSALWAHPKVLVTPHDIDRSPRTSERSRSLFFENLRRFVGERALLNRVSYEKGY